MHQNNKKENKSRTKINTKEKQVERKKNKMTKIRGNRIGNTDSKGCSRNYRGKMKFKSFHFKFKGSGSLDTFNANRKVTKYIFIIKSLRL